MSPSRSKAIVRPSGETSTFIQLPWSTLIGIWRVTMPGGALTSHLSDWAGLTAGVRAPWVAGSGPVTFCSGLITWFSGAWVSWTGALAGGDWVGGVWAATAVSWPAAIKAAMTDVTRYSMHSLPGS